MSVCKLPVEIGPCRGSYRRWAYDQTKGACVEFFYGGCKGNGNNFETKDTCEAKCGGTTIPSSNPDTPEAVCKLPPEVGPCRASERRWAFDATKGNCIEFIYGGCQGNANNFKTKTECETKCGG